MLKTRLLQAACTVALLAAAPAFAQTATPPAGMAAGSASGQDTGPAKTSMPTTMAPASKDTMHPMHHSAMNHSGHMMHAGKAGASHESTTDSLNDKSYQAAQNGQPASVGTDKSSTGMMKSGGSGSMNDMSGGSMTGNGATAPK